MRYWFLPWIIMKSRYRKRKAKFNAMEFEMLVEEVNKRVV